jgi:hypothetical protein
MRHAVPRANPCIGRNIVAKYPVDGLGARPYMALQRRTRPSLQGQRSFRASSWSVQPMPGTIEPGEDARRLFDIVGLDEGTCGRRPGHR